jgi:iron complex outermembrane receptor protein
VSTLVTPGLIALGAGPAAAQAPAPPPPAPPPAAPAPAPAAPPPPPAAAAAPVTPIPPPPPPAGVVPVPVPAAPAIEPAQPGEPPATVSTEELSPEELAALEEKDLDVVKVTVDRREKNIQTYAGSASAYTQDQLDRVGVTSLRQLANHDPYLEIGTQEGNTEIFIRGIGGTDNTELGDPAAATYFGGVYIPRPRGVGSMFYDLERVEVNRGPQGTLRGRNATAGSINLIPAAPHLDQLEAMGDILIGNYYDRMTKAMLNVPVAPHLALRLATFSDNHNPYYNNGGPVGTITPSENADVLSGRASLLWTPVHAFKAQIVADWTHEGGTGYTGTNYAPALQAGLLPEEVPDPRAVVFRGPQPALNMHHSGIAGTFTLDLGPALVELISSYRDMTYYQVTGGNAGVAFPGMPDPQIDNWSTSYWHTSSKSTVQELRVFAPDTARLRWTAGGFFFFEKQTGFLASTNDQGNGYAGVEYNMPYVHSHSEAAYADATFDITKFLRATGGLRFTHEHKERHGLGAVFLPDTGGQTFRFGTEGFSWADAERTIYDPSGVLNKSDIFFNGVSRFGARDTLQNLLVSADNSYTRQDGYYHDNFLDWRVGADFDLTPRNFLYLMANTGHHSGGFNDNVVLNGTNAGAPNYKPERLYAIEAGSKNQTADRRLTANVAVFGYLYRDQQFQGVQSLINPGDPTMVGAPTLVRFNVAESHVIGLDFDGSYKLPFGFIVGLRGELLDSVFDSGIVRDSRLGYDIMSEPPVDLKGHRLPRAPRISVAYSLGQNFSTPHGYIDWVVSAQTRSKYYMTVFNGEGTDTSGNVNPVLSDVQPAYTRLDAGIGYTRPDGKMRIEATGANLTNTTYMTTLINTPGLNLRFFNPPRTYGVHIQLFY